MQLRDYQQRAVDEIYGYFRAGRNPGNPLAVLPTAAGKSVIIGKLCQDILEQWPNQRLVILSHVRELIEQDYERLLQCWPGAPAGLYCAALNKRQHSHPIVVASIQSVYRKAHLLGWRDLIFIDECHLLSPNGESMYQTFIAGLKQINPHLRVIGFTATPYRMKSGLLTEGNDALFTDVATEVTIQDLLEAGYLCRLVSKASLIQADLSEVRITAGEYNTKDAEEAMDKMSLTESAIEEIKTLASTRKSWLIFCTGVKHAEHFRDALRRHDISAETVTGETPKEERTDIIRRFKAGDIRALTNANVLTTGFDAPQVDCLVLLRPTQSPGLYCLSEDTEILTREGFKGIDQITADDEIAAPFPDTLELSWSPPLAILKRPILTDEKRLRSWRRPLPSASVRRKST
jgi:DNA repair protein RadD